MGKPRVYGNNARIYVVNPVTQVEIQVGEVDKFKAKNDDELRKSKALGEAEYTSQTTFGGYSLDFEGGKVDASLAALFHAQDDQISHGGRSPYFVVRERIKHLDGTIEEWIYPEVTLHGYDMDAPAEDQLTEKFQGFCGKKKQKSKSATTPDLTGTVTAILAVMKEKSNSNSMFGSVLDSEHIPSDRQAGN